jgi:hypothetical protein
METKLRQLLPQFRRGCLAERNPNPPADNLGEIEQTRIAGFQKFQNFRDRQGAVFLPRLCINRQTIVRLLRWRFRCCGVVTTQLCGSAPEPLNRFFVICFHGLFLTALLCVFCPSPFTKKRSRQPSLRKESIGRSPRRAGWYCGDAVRAMERNGEQKKPDLKTWQRHLL